MESVNNNNSNNGSSQNELEHSILLRSDGLAMFYLQGIRSLFIEPYFSFNDKKHIISAKSSSASDSSADICCKVKSCDISGTTSVSESKRGVKYSFKVTPSTQAPSLDVILSLQLFPDVWMNGEISSTSKHDAFVIKESRTEPNNTNWQSSHITLKTSFGPSIRAFFTQDGKEAPASWNVIENLSKQKELQSVDVECSVHVEDWDKKLEKTFELSLVLEDWTAKFEPRIEVTEDVKKHLFEQGYYHFKNVVPPEMCDNLVRAINHQMGLASLAAKKQRSQNKQDRKEGKQYEKPQGNIGNFFPALKRSPLLFDLVSGTHVLDIIESFIGRGNMLPLKGGQIALRHPTTQDTPVTRLAKNAGPAIPSAFKKDEYHIDGKYDGENSIPEGTIGNFTLLVGVFLKDLPAENSGNLVVYPGTHWKHAAYFQKDGPLSFLDGEGMPPYFKTDPKLPAPRQITGKKGDVVICHFLLGHTVSPNCSPDIRYKTYFRVCANTLFKHKTESMVELWQDWLGMSEMAQKAKIEDFYKVQ